MDKTLIIICGKTASGKTRIVSELVKNHGFKKIITFTTRPKRENEKEGIDYHFISDEDFKQKIQDGFFAEWKIYKTKFGEWYYGTSLEDLENADEKSVIILTPDGYRDVVKMMETKPKSIYIYASARTICARLKKRGDNAEEVQRRILSDNEDFKDFYLEVDKIVYNNDGTKIEDVVNKILEFTARSNDN